jgi:N-6 DNA Methylase
MARPFTFPTIRTEGGLLPTDLLSQVIAGSLPGMSSEIDYHLAPHERLNEAVSRSWNRLIAAWVAFKVARARLAPGELATSETREKWLLPLFAELGYGRLAPTRAIELDGRSYPISHEWGIVPIHLVGAGVELDQRAPGVAGAARMSPHGLVQELLNASGERLWGVVSNGLQLRLLRDSAAITRQAFVEFDLEEMMDGEVYSDFVVLWLVCHQSRLEGDRPESCWVEKWSQHAIEQGTRALNHLREGVEAAITSLGRGFLVHPANAALRDALREGSLDREGYYRQLLRIVYRLIFLMVAEDRDLLHAPNTAPLARQTYADHYSVARLRRLAERRRGSAHSDLYEGLTLVMNALGRPGGIPPLGLPALGSFLWHTAAVQDLASCRLRNRDLLEAMTALAFTNEGRLRRAVDYRNLGSEELGSIYESLLELHPELSLDAGSFALATGGGHERKLTGSYYTPTSLIACLLDSALDPLLAEATSVSDPETAILNLKIVDPACGSGHFLIAAAHRIAKCLASVRTGDLEAAPEAVRRALRDVIGRCIHGVDMNEMAVELCKVSLWMEALEPGRPLSFLDHRILLGNSLVGATPALLARGIPDEAFRPMEGDERDIATSLRRRNREEVAGQTLLFTRDESAGSEVVGRRATELDALPDDDLTAIVEKENRYRQLVSSSEIERARLAADAWCAAFVAPKRRGDIEITEDVRHRLANGSLGAASAARTTVEGLAAEYRFMHWHLAFPSVFRMPGEHETADNTTAGWSGGFDLVLGNPPWERVKLQEQEWFAERDREIADLPGAKRKKRIAELTSENPALHAEYVAATRHAEGVSHLLRDSGRFPLCGRGDVNTYSVFAELMRTLMSPIGRAGIIVPSGIATEDTTKEFFASLVESESLVSLFSFVNSSPLFATVHRDFRFCLLTLSGSDRPHQGGAEFTFFAVVVSDLADANRRFRLTADDLRLLNPNTRTCPIFRTSHDAELAKSVYRRVPVLIDRSRSAGNPWSIRFMTMFHMTNDSRLFRTAAELMAEGWAISGNTFGRGGDQYLPLYEGKMFQQFDHRWASADERSSANARDHSAEARVMPRYWVPEIEVRNKLDGWPEPWFLAWRNITNATNERTIVATILPLSGVGHSASIGLLAPEVAMLAPTLGAALSSLALDFVARYKVGWVNLSYFMIEQLPMISPDVLLSQSPWDPDRTMQEWLEPRLAELYCTSVDLQPLATVLHSPSTIYEWEEARRELIRAEVDAAFFHLYGLARDEVAYALNSFGVLRQREEIAYGEYRTHRLVTERYDAMAEATLSSTSYTSVLDFPSDARNRVVRRSR